MPWVFHEFQPDPDVISRYKVWKEPRLSRLQRPWPSDTVVEWRKRVTRNRERSRKTERDRTWDFPSLASQQRALLRQRVNGQWLLQPPQPGRKPGSSCGWSCRAGGQLRLQRPDNSLSVSTVEHSKDFLESKETVPLAGEDPDPHRPGWDITRHTRTPTLSYLMSSSSCSQKAQNSVMTAEDLALLFLFVSWLGHRVMTFKLE